MAHGDEQWKLESAASAKVSDLDRYWEQVCSDFCDLASDLKHDKHDEPPRIILAMQERTFFHPKTGHMYRVRGHVWDSGRDRHLLRYVRVKGIGMSADKEDHSKPYVHLPEDFLRAGRFLEVKG